MSNPLKKIGRFLGAGFRTGAADDDPSGIATYSITGAQTGFSFLWLMVYVIPLMTAIQEMSAHIGALSGVGLAGNIKRHYSRWLVLIVAITLVTANVFNIGADIAGMSGAINLLVPVPVGILAVIVCAIVLYITIRFSYRHIAQILNWFALTLLAYVVSFLLFKSNNPHLWSDILKNALIPHLPKDKNSLIVLFAILGTTISPYLYFWQADEEAEQTKQIEKHLSLSRMRMFATDRLRKIDFDTRFGMIFSNFIAFFIIALAGASLYNGGGNLSHLQTLRDIASTLEPIAGHYAFIIFTVGLVTAGLLAIPVLAGSAAYVISEMFDWPASLDKKFNQAKQFYVVLIVSVLLGLFLPFLGISPSAALFYSAVVNAVASPLLIVLIIHMAHNPKVVGDHRVNPMLAGLGYIGFFIMTVGSIFFIGTSDFLAPATAAAASILSHLK